MNPARAVLVACVAALAPAQDPQDAPPGVTWSTDLDATVREAAADARPTLVFFTASWCVPCQDMKERVLSTPEFADAFAGHAFVMIDIDRQRPVAQAWQVGPIPDLRFVDARGEEIGGVVGGRSLDGLLEVRAAAERAAERIAELRRAVEESPDDASARLALAERLLERPTRHAGVAAAERAIAADPTGDAGVAARGHWLVVGARFAVLGRASDADLADAERRLTALEDLTTDPRAPTYADAVRAWIEWTAAMRAWGDARRDGDRDQPLSVATDAPLRQTLARLVERAEAPADDAAGAAADGLLIDGLLNYYSGEYELGAARLAAFTRDHPAHRFAGEGRRFLGIVQRLQRAGGPSK